MCAPTKPRTRAETDRRINRVNVWTGSMLGTRSDPILTRRARQRFHSTHFTHFCICLNSLVTCGGREQVCYPPVSKKYDAEKFLTIKLKTLENGLISPERTKISPEVSKYHLHPSKKAILKKKKKLCA